MDSAKHVGRITGLLLLLHLTTALMVPFIILDRIRGSAGFFANAAAHAGEFRIAVLLLFVGSALAMACAIVAFPVFRRGSSALAIWLVALAVAAFSLQVVDNAALLSLLSLSQQSADAGGDKAGTLQTLDIAISALRKGAHYSYLLIAVSWIFSLCFLLYRFSLVPRALAAFGVLACLAQICAVPLRVLLGYPPEMRLALPMLPAYLGLALWLLVRGLNESHLPPQAERQHAEAAFVSGASAVAR